MLNFISTGLTVEAAAGDNGEPAKRTISGIAVPYGVEATVSDGRKVVMEPGSLSTTGKNPKLYQYHDETKAVGTVVKRVEAEDGSAMLFEAKVVNTSAGSDALIMAAEGVLDSVSIGVVPTKYYEDANGTLHVQAADWKELSLVPTPAFAGATISTVTASADTTPDDIPAEPTEPVEETPEVENAPVEAAAAPEVVTPTPIFASAKKEARLPSAAEYLAAFHIGGDVRASVENAILDYKKQNETAFEAAAGDETTSGQLTGLLSTMVLGPTFNALAYVRPIVSALGPRAMPNPGGTSFVRPVLSTHTSVAQQAAELNTVSTTSGVVTPVSVPKVTLGGSFDISYQAIDFTSPDALNVLITDLAGKYLLATESYTATNLLAAATSSGVWDLSVTDFMTSIYDAAVDISSTTNRMPTHIMCSVDVWAQISKLQDTSNRPIFAYTGGNGLAGYNALGNQNAGTWTGVNPMGLEMTVSTMLPAKSLVILNKDAFEVYEQFRGMLSVEQPSTLSRLISMFGYVANATVSGQMIRKITQA